MKRRLLVLLVALVGCNREPSPTVSGPANPGSGSAAAPDPWAAKDEPPPAPLPRAMLWSISKDGKTSYAFGTMHIGIDPQRLPKVVWDKLEGATSFAMETDASDASILGLGQRASGTLRDDLGPDYWAKLEKLIDPGTLAGVNKMKPVVAGVMLSMRGLPMTALGMDTALLFRAQQKGKPVVYLEAASKQAALLDKWMDVKALKLMIDTADKSLEMTKGMMAAYIAGDDKKMVAMNDGQKAEALAHGIKEAEYDQQTKEMLYDRNASWIDAIEAMHAKGGGFIAVGALHLVGKQSVLELLEAKGYKVARVQ
jgi:uncharacterized protein YbaP (TraB family)